MWGWIWQPLYVKFHWRCNDYGDIGGADIIIEIVSVALRRVVAESKGTDTTGSGTGINGVSDGWCNEGHGIGTGKIENIRKWCRMIYKVEDKWYNNGQQNRRGMISMDP